MNNIAIFASGTGTNFDVIIQNIENGYLDANVSLVVCDKLGAKVIEKAVSKNIETLVFNPKDYESKADYEKIILEKCLSNKCSYIILAGYMRLLSDVLLDGYKDKIINIHPSLLPAFKGKDAIGQAINYGVKVMGVTIHFVNKEMDGGKIIAQESFNVDPSWSHDEIEAKVHSIEHILYSKTIKELLEGKI